MKKIVILSTLLILLFTCSCLDLPAPGTTTSGQVSPIQQAPLPNAPAGQTQVKKEFIRLYYFGSMTTSGDPASVTGPHNIYSAVSSDGINFKEDEGVRFSYDAGGKGGITDPDIVRLNDGSWLMFASLGMSLLKATSPLSYGVFQQEKSFQWSGGGVPGSFNFKGKIRTYVCSQGGISYAAYDQITGRLNPVGIAIAVPPGGGIICDPSVIEIDGKCLMFYKFQRGNLPPSEHEVWLAKSDDGIKWTQHSENRFICMGSVPGAVYYEGVIYIYYCGQVNKTGPKGDLGVAISRDKGATFEISVARIDGKKALGAVDPAPVVVKEGE